MSLAATVKQLVLKYEQVEHLYEQQTVAMELMDIWPEILFSLRRREKLEVVAKAAKDFINSDGDYFAWAEDERQCMSRLRDTLATLEEDV